MNHSNIDFTKLKKESESVLDMINEIVAKQPTRTFLMHSDLFKKN